MTQTEQAAEAEISMEARPEPPTEAVPEVPARPETPVGYGHPPRHTQFQKGRSGNPGGRPRRSSPVHDALCKILGDSTTLECRSGPKTVLNAELLADVILKKAAEGDPRILYLLLRDLR